MIATCQIDTTNWLRGHELLHRYSRTMPSEALAKSVAFVVKDAKARTAYVPPDRIDTELAVQVTPVIGARGKPLSTKYAKNRVYNANGTGSGGNPYPEVPLAWLMIGARANVGSKFNASTSGRWAIAGGHPFKGHSVSEFAGIMSQLVSRMVKSRRSSTHFFEQSWNAVLTALAPFVPARYQAYFQGAAGRTGMPNEIGKADMAGRGTLAPSLRIENRLGMDGEFPNLDAQRNAAAHRILEPALQAAIDRNFEEQMEIAARRGLLDEAPKLRVVGFEVR